MLRLPPMAAIGLLALALPLAGCLDAPEDFACTAESDGNHLTWSAVDGATGYDIFRFEPGDEPTLENAVLIASTTETSYIDMDVMAGETYHYTVAATGESPGNPAEPCRVESVPFFPGMLAAGLAVAGAIGAVVLARRR